jgi:hypothetical protein
MNDAPATGCPSEPFSAGSDHDRKVGGGLTELGVAGDDDSNRHRRTRTILDPELGVGRELHGIAAARRSGIGDEGACDRRSHGRDQRHVRPPR